MKIEGLLFTRLNEEYELFTQGKRSKVTGEMARTKKQYPYRRTGAQRTAGQRINPAKMVRGVKEHSLEQKLRKPLSDKDIDCFSLF